MADYSFEQQGCERLIRLMNRAAATAFDSIRMEDVVFTMTYMAYYLPQGYDYHEDAFVRHLEIASDLTTVDPDFLNHFKQLTELLCNLVPSMDYRKVDFLSRVFHNWHLCLTKIPAEQRQELSGSISTQFFVSCRRYMVAAPLFSLQLKMLEILHLYFGSAMIGFLRTNELPPDGLAYLDSKDAIDSFFSKQEYLIYINMWRKNKWPIKNDLILSLPVESVKYGENLIFVHSVSKEKRVWFHWNQRLGTFEIWMCGMKATISDNQLDLLEMKRDGLTFEFTLNSPPEFENKLGKKFQSAIDQYNFVEVSFKAILPSDWQFPLQHSFQGRFRYVPMNGSAPETESKGSTSETESKRSTPETEGKRSAPETESSDDSSPAQTTKKPRHSTE